MSNVLMVLLLTVLSYGIGAFPTAYLVGRCNHINIFSSGSGNMGANNTYHTLGVGWAALVWVIDVGKGILATVLARTMAPASLLTLAGALSGLAVVIGHSWSLWALLLVGKLRGGKGAATAGGTWLVNAPPMVFAVTVGLWAIIAGSTGYVTLATLLMFAVGVLWMLALASIHAIAPVAIIYVIGVAAVIYWRHRTNLRALIDGHERQITSPTVQTLMVAAGLIVLVLNLVR